MKLSCVVPATDEPPTLRRCLDAIEGAERPPEELIVVTEPARAGPALARNAGAGRAGGEVIVFIDADVLVHRDVFARVRDAFDREPGLVAVFGSYDDEPEASDAVSGFRNLLHHHVHQQGGGPAATFWTGLGAIRRQALADAGGFDAERYPRPSLEDVELGMRIAEAGGDLRLDPQMQGTHLKRWTLAQMVRTDYGDRGLPWARLLLRTGSAPATLNLGWRHRLSAGAALGAALSLALRRPRALALALSSLIALNLGFYRLLWRKRGPGGAAAGVGLHVVHHLTGAAAAGTAAAEAARDQLGGTAS